MFLINTLVLWKSKKSKNTKDASHVASVTSVTRRGNLPFRWPPQLPLNHYDLSDDLPGSPPTPRSPRQLIPPPANQLSCFVFVYDVTIGYKHRCPTLIDNVFGVDPSEVHIHAQRILLSEIPTSEIEAAKWLIARFKFKDKLLADFTTLGYFPNPGTEGDLSTVACLAKCSMVMVLTGIFVYLTLFSSIWFKIYVSFSCASLSFATYFKVLPSPLLDCTKALFYGKIKKM
ncbi:hypothetical protein B296_00016178 [Ensete ventricosum]|uniref:1-acylglycerol-3-phosphate O-acyltransferase n=1 Tax=Ensete ventricosum TaxID=4639 RepID=A0A427A9B5_ENSVE|nr:hypothetical protein B296_00016178 [Ensete ventricosum]